MPSPSPDNRQTVTPVAEGVYQVRIPLPLRLNHIYSYLLRSATGWTIVDFGLNWSGAHTAWKEALTELKIGPDDVEKLFLTHMHPDHFGMAGWFQQWCGLPIHLSALTAEQIERVWIDHAWDPEKIASWWAKCGIPTTISSTASDRAVSLRENTMPHPDSKKFKLVEPNTQITLGDRLFRTIHAPGHAEGQLLLHDEDGKLLLSGDQVLMKITPNIGLWPTSSPNPLDNYLTSLESLKQLDVDLALPGHMGLITDWPSRIEEIIEHHDYRLDKTLESLGSPNNGYHVGQVLFPLNDLSPHEVRFAVAETMAHIEYLVRKGKVNRFEQPGNQPDLFQRA